MFDDITWITSFTGENRWLSNFWPATVMLDNVYYPSVENAYQAAKTLVLEDRVAFRACTAAQAKKLGRKLKVRQDWDNIKISVMRDLLSQKFTIAELAEKLKATGDANLVEGNTWGDTFWGMCDGKGHNHLGTLLMFIREQI